MLDLYDCVEWRQWLWYPPTQWAIGDPARFKGKRLLEIGPGRGFMSCYFASLGAHVTAADCSRKLLDTTRLNSYRFSVRLECLHFSGDYYDLPTGFDFVFTKSALVMTGQAKERAAQIPRLLKPDGEYIGIENLDGGFITQAVRRFNHRESADFYSRFSPITEDVKQVLEDGFEHVEYRSRLQSVIAIRAYSAKQDTLTLSLPVNAVAEATSL